MCRKVSLVIAVFALLLLFVKCSTSENFVICPSQCTCQQAFLMDLPVARWINSQHYRSPEDTSDKTEKEHLVNDNEASYGDDDNSHLNNPVVSFAMCMIQSKDNLRIKILELPEDVQVLVLLYSDESVNSTIYASDFLVLTELNVLEIRGISSQTMRMVIDDELPTLQYANFESIHVEGSELLRRPQQNEQPFHKFDYRPYRERLEYNVSMEEQDESEEVVILPYDVYVMEMKKSKIATFYGWLNLLVLRMHNCRLNEINWEMFDGLKNLQHLSLEHNQIKMVPPFAFYGAMNIKTLSLARNEILDLSYRSMAGLLQLERLDLSFNNLTKLSDVTFPPFPKLDTVDFRHNPIANIFTETFGVMNTTKRIYLGDASAALDLSPNENSASFKYLNHLTHLTIMNVSIPVLHQKIFKGLVRLEVLKLKGLIMRIEFDAFSNLHSLSELYLSHCQITELSMDSFFGAKGLNIIDLSFNKLMAIPPGIFDDQSSLKEIYLQNNSLSKLPANFFTKSNYKLVRLTENPWYCTCAMTSWKQGMTNRVKSGKQKCIRDLTSKKQTIVCSDEDEYVFDNKVVPRCGGGPAKTLNRSVYYALRKDLNCVHKDKSPKRVKPAGTKETKQARLIQPSSKHDLMEQMLKNTLYKNSKTQSKPNHHLKFLQKVQKTNQHNKLVYQLALKGKPTQSSQHEMNNDL